MPSPDISPPPLKRRPISGPHLPTPHHPSPPPLTPHPANNVPSTSTKDSLRIYSWNINGISPFLPPSTRPITTFLKPPSTSTTPSTPAPPPPSLRARLRRWQWPHLVCLQEVKIAPTDTKTQAAVRRAVNASLDTDDENDPGRPLYDASFCLPRDRYNATAFGGRVYGVCTLVRRDVPTRATRTVDWDLEGRVLLVEMAAWALVAVNVYAVNGTAAAYRDPLSGTVRGDRHGRKRRFHSLLRDEVRRYEDRGWQVVVAGDLNVARQPVDSAPRLRVGPEHVRSRADFEMKFIAELGLRDSFRLLHGLRRTFSYRPRHRPWGQAGDRVDLILVTKGLGDRGRVRGADVLDTEEERGPSDHVPLFVELRVGRVERVDGGGGG